MGMYYFMNENEPVEVNEGVDGGEGDKPAAQTGPPVVTVTVKVHWPGSP
jgi:hypothetical protein